jgi:hypothetical protein
MVDKASGPVFLKAKEEKFIPTKGYGDRGITWVDSGIIYKTEKYAYPDYMKIRKFGNFDLTEKTIFGKTEYMGQKAEATKASKKKKETFYEKRRLKIIETNSLKKLKQMLSTQKKLIDKAKQTGASQAELKEEKEILALLKNSIDIMENIVKKLKIGSLQQLGNQYKQEECPISLEKFTASDTDIAKLPCGHLFKKDAIIGWLKTKNTCPLCKKKVK